MNNKIKEMALIVKELDQSTDGTFYTEEIATALYNAGYRKQSDTIREFAEKLKALPNRDYAHSYQLGCLVLSDKDINELAVEYGVEVE